MPHVPTELKEQEQVAQYLELLMKQGKVVEYSAVPNNTFTRSWNQKRKLKREGVRPGVPDMLVVTPNEVAFIEMKRSKGGAVSPAQKRWIKAIEATGTRVVVAKGFDEAKAFIDSLE